jgi:hypothetical protein
VTHRFTEIEFYYHGPDHYDAFTHRNPLQKEPGRWCLHRSGKSLRNGSFKGLDLSFGHDDAHAGILIRGLETDDGKLIDGPSLCVDHLLAVTGSASLGLLDRSLAGSYAWDDASPLRLRTMARPEGRPIHRSGRIGLTLKRAQEIPDMQRFLCLPFRYLTEPRRIAKGRLNLILTLWAHGTSAGEIRALTGCSRNTLGRYLADFEAGRRDADFAPYLGTTTTPADLCRLHGVWYAHHGTGLAPDGFTSRVSTPSTGGIACRASS